MNRYVYAPRIIDDDEFIFDTKTDDRIEYMSEVCDLLNQQDEKIKELEEQLEMTEQMRQEMIDEGLKCEQQHIKNQNIIAIGELNKILKQLTATTNPNILKYLIQRIKELEGKENVD